MDKKFKNIIDIFEEEKNNLYVSIKKFKEEIKFLNRIGFLYQYFIKTIKDYPKEKVPILQMFYSCFRNFYISTELMLKTHIPEAYTIISRSAEAVALARKFSKNSEIMNVWLKSKKNEKFIDKYGKLFPKEDSLLYPEIYNIYNLTSNYGRHQNFESTIFFTDTSNLNNNIINFNFSYIDDEQNLRRCINYLIYCYLKFLEIFNEIFKENLNKKYLQEFNILKNNFNLYKKSLLNLFKRKV